MPQAPDSLSKSQILALESCWLFIRTVRGFLLSLGNELDPVSRERLDAQCDFARMNETRLLEAFPEIRDAAARWSAPERPRS